jgi:hypothetical protein
LASRYDGENGVGEVVDGDSQVTIVQKSGNLFERLFKYPTGEVQPFENQMTETLAALCERCPGFKERFFALFVDASLLSSENIHIQTQSRHNLPGQTSKAIDLEFWQQDEEETRTFTGFIEVKVHSSENYSLLMSANGEVEFVEQTIIYEKILLDPEYGTKVGLFTLTPYVNPLKVYLSLDTERFVSTRNVYWHEVGQIAEELIEATKYPIEKFLMCEYREYLKRSGMMSDQKITIQDLAIMENYLPVKEKMWRSLDALSTHLKTKLGGERTTFKTASSQEEQRRFCIYKYLDPSTELAIFAGYYFFEDDIPWVGVWIEMNPKNKSIENVAKDLCEGLTVNPKGTSEEFEKFNVWNAFERSDEEWWIACNARQMIEFVNDENAVDSIQKYLKEKIDELLALKALEKWTKK